MFFGLSVSIGALATYAYSVGSIDLETVIYSITAFICLAFLASDPELSQAVLSCDS